ncbi:hypothetical protein PT974_07261 [Cladobotryum mycophilum]|uniref:Clr5 domain-containing protein n=1 Tax=Cladobotryum mycophilum TaxID=491253 RepID=A0ABR0SP06_9HYPO
MEHDGLLSPSEEAKFLQLSYEERLEHLKPVIIELYMGNHGPEGKRLPMRQVVEAMRVHYSFQLSQNQLEYTLRKWEVRRRILSSEKDAITTALGKRTRAGASTSTVGLQQGKKVDKKQLKRYLDDQIRHHEVDVMTPGIFSTWNLPYAALLASVGGQPNQPSPFGLQGITPPYITIKSPAEKAIQDWSNLFLQGRHKQLLETCGREDRIILSNYLHEFWVHSFVTAKYWGRGPQAWTREMISALTLNDLDTPNMTSPSSLNILVASSPHSLRDVPPPTKLCQWAIHVAHRNYEEIPEMQQQTPNIFDIQDPLSWQRWSGDELHRSSFVESMTQSITSSNFTAISPHELPVSTDLIMNSVQKDAGSLLVDAWKFAIMAGNTELLESLYLKGRHQPPNGLQEIYPFHLAASFIDGGNTCCNMIEMLCSTLNGDFRIAKNNIDNLGHTVLDTIIISILRSHTTIAPDRVSSGFHDATRYPGEEKDICGRWDADSPEICRLFQRGACRVPHDWKHPFCHSSVQAACHSAIAIYSTIPSPNINDSSGLFTQRCSHCGLELRLMPLHTLVIMTFYLAQCGIQGETLFGSVAILVCLLRLGADTSLTAEVSLAEFLGLSEADRCSHKVMQASELLQEIPDHIIASWSSECRTGWHCIGEIFLLAKVNEISSMSHDSDDSDDSDDYTAFYCSMEDYDDVGVERRWPCSKRQLGLLWATIQVELLTYRRVSASDPWISPNFSMYELQKWLLGETEEFRIPLVQKRMMKAHSRCGWFECERVGCPTAEEVCQDLNFMNMDIYSRASFIPRP